MDYAQWCKSPQLQAELREILNHPTVKIALSIVKDTGLPNLSACPYDNCTFLEWQAGKAFYSQGYFDHERNLVQLAYVPEGHVKAANAETKPVLGPWEYQHEAQQKQTEPVKPLRPAPPLKIPKSPKTPVKKKR
jgi:hypothetical protein